MHWLFSDMDGGGVVFTLRFFLSLEHGLSLSRLLMLSVLWVTFSYLSFPFQQPTCLFFNLLPMADAHSAGGSWCRFGRCSPSKQLCVFACPETHWKLNRNETCSIWNNASELFLCSPLVVFPQVPLHLGVWAYGRAGLVKALGFPTSLNYFWKNADRYMW